MNELDLLIALILVLGTLSGLIRGAGKLLISLLSLWLSLIISLWLFKPLSDIIIGGMVEKMSIQMSTAARDILAFLALLILISNLISLVVNLTTVPPEERKRKRTSDLEEIVEKGTQRFIIGPLNYLGGLVLGFVWTVFWLSLLLAMVQFALSAAPDSALAATVHSSLLIGIFNNVLGYVYLSIKFFIPDRLPGIFSALIST